MITNKMKLKLNNKTCEYQFKNYLKGKEDYSWSTRICICENSKYLSTADNLVTECDEIIIAMVLYEKKDNYYSSKCCEYCFNKLFIIYYYLLLLCKAKSYNIEWKIMNFKKFVYKIVRVIISMT